MPAAGPRIPPLEPPYAPDIAAAFERVMPKGEAPLKLFRTLAHNPRVMHRFFAASLLDPGSIEKREREIVILRTTANCRSEYEWGVHVQRFGRRYGLSEAQIAATRLGAADDAAWDRPSDRLLLALVDQLHACTGIDETTWRAARAHWSPAQLLEIVVLAGFYHMVSFVTEAFAIDFEDDADRFPLAVQHNINQTA